MAVTTSTSVTGTVNAKVIEDLIVAYQYDDVTAAGYFRYKSIAGQATAVASFPRYTKDSVGTVATETTSLTPTTFSIGAGTDITVARVGIAREITNTAIEDSLLGRALYVAQLVADAAILYGEQLDTDCTALFGSSSQQVGSTGTALTIATMVAGFAQQRTNKARGPQVFHLHDLQAKQLQQAQAAATATPWATFYQPNADSSAFLGYFMGAPGWASAKNPTANGAADRVGSIWSQGQAAPQFCGYAYVSKRMPTSLEQTDILQDANIWASFSRYGVGIVANNFTTKIISQNA
jgi:hypothetical protein